jgi:hypothetical protein
MFGDVLRIPRRGRTVARGRRNDRPPDERETVVPCTGLAAHSVHADHAFGARLACREPFQPVVRSGHRTGSTFQCVTGGEEMSKPVAKRARLITVGVALVGMSASLLVVSANALDSITVDRAELDDGLLRVEGEGAVPDAIVWVISAESTASSRADDDGRIRLLAPNFQSSNCQVTVTDGATSGHVSLDECTPTAPPATTTTSTTTTTQPPPTTTTEPTTTTTEPPPTTTTEPPATTTSSITTTTATTTLPSTSTTTTTVPPTTVPSTPVTFTDLHDLVPQRCLSAALSTVGPASVRIGIESGYNSATWQNKACIAATTAFNPRSVSDTFTVTVAAPPGQHITRVQYQQTGSRYLERSLYWRASGTGQLTANGVSVPFSFTLPNLTKTIDLTGQNVKSTTISISISMSAGRSDNQPRVTNPPGSAAIIVASAVISVEST